MRQTFEQSWWTIGTLLTLRGAAAVVDVYLVDVALYGNYLALSTLAVIFIGLISIPRNTMCV